MVAAIFERGVIRATGPDVTTYLQGQISQDLSTLETGSSTWSLLLQPTGKLTSWFRIHRLTDDEYLLDLEPDAVANTLARLERFKLRTKADFVVEPGWRMLSVRNGDAPKAEGLTAPFEWPGFSGQDVLSADLMVDEDSLDPGAYETARLGAGVPRMGIDLDGETIPAEGGAALIEMSVSFTKGCYTGQELVARIDSRGGNVPRPIRTMQAGSPVAVGATITFQGAEVGTVTSAAGTLAMARVLRKIEPGSTVDIGGVEATVQAPPHR